MNARLSETQQRVFERLRDHAVRYGEAPELAPLARELGMHYVSLKQHLEALNRKGYVHFESRGRGRSPRLELPPEATGVPVLGAIPAGPWSEAVAHAEAYLPLGGMRDRSFALRVQGDSMADLIQHGDVVLFEKRPPERSGLICAVRIGESDATLKYLDRLDDERFALRPHNQSHPTSEVRGDELVVEGVYQGLMRGELLERVLTV